MIITAGVDTAVQYFIIGNSRLVSRRRNAARREAGNGVGGREGEKSIRNRVLRASSGWEKLVGGNGGLTRIICGIGEKRKTGGECMYRERVYVPTCARGEKEEEGKRDGKCTKRERNDGKRDGIHGAR